MITSMRKLLNKELNRKNTEDYKRLPKLKLVVVLDDVRSMNNIGSVFRTSDAFLVEKIILCGITATPPNNEIRKTALGSTESVNWEYKKRTLEAIQLLKDDGYTIIAVEQTEHAIQLHEFLFEYDKKYALIFGNEVKGVDQEVVNACDLAIEIPQEGTKHSLNVSVSAGIVIWEFYKNLHS
jgi:23S rRNA (guanosine2251-2'-O)-methyltransferase